MKTMIAKYPGTCARFGFEAQGCWTVETSNRGEPPNAVAGFATLAEARACGETLPFPWDKLTK